MIRISEFVFPWRGSLLGGLGLIGFGLLALVAPQILVALVSAFFISLGLAITWAALALKRANRAYEFVRSRNFDLF